MRAQCLGAGTLFLFLAAARATTTTVTVMVDDSDPGIEYRGSWVHNAIDDPKDFNYGGSTTFTNATGSTASYRFHGTGIAVYGAFAVAGTFAMHSSYSIDGEPPTDFLPAGTVLKPAYRQKFFQSAPLSDGAHTLVITNLEREFWLDYLLVAQSSAATTAPASASAAPQAGAQTPPPTTHSSTSVQAALSATSPGTTASFAGTQSSSRSFSQTSQSTSTPSFSNTNNTTLTSTDAAALPPSDTNSSASQSQTSDLASGIASPSSTAARARSSKLPAGAIAGVAVGGLLVLLLVVGVVGYRCRRRKQVRRRRPDLAPYDPGLTALALETSEKRVARHDSDAASRGSTVTSVLTLPPPLPLPQSAPANARFPAETRASGTSGERSVPHEIRTTDLDVEAVAAGAGAAVEEMSGGRGDRRTGFEPLGSPSSASPLLARRSPGMRTQKDSPVTPSAGMCRYGSPPDIDVDVEGGRRSLDGGVRLAGGPPDAENASLGAGRGDDARSGVSTLPPAYRVYPAA